MVKVISNVATLYMSFEDLVILLTLFFFSVSVCESTS